MFSMIVICYHRSPWCINKESVELTFVNLTEGCGKTRLEINDTIPHTRVDMGYQGAERTHPQVPKPIRSSHVTPEQIGPDA